ncbi:MAG: hypothetical protein A2845_01105 [Candidatus Lloydbacteria bacterium RIFCSPHIGHO2_01_FULL_49_22]|uniref:Uncharacterized protein n=1 Tax=Candidatus Lloydbacteria bacterium RIFCSPHIGHO2_01_FULL_49_22 TaxID=1798658 RepID=A0A1G2CYH1_9BACT|nr:MAG: hypothetical protein A2845_01105 [Candidatus Lloydbacteria bacterium RIFCSPHIGHO2_01_FULL_49_22]OGZ09222.1 MAG: hypothetical protein A3C14_06110 [Candidatus Lloydbacteria bacterium RIFCSPHIGHO2_02_FULL_50_18]
MCAILDQDDDDFDGTVQTTESDGRVPARISATTDDQGWLPKVVAKAAVVAGVRSNCGVDVLMSLAH